MSFVTAIAGEAFESTVEGSETGLVGTISVELIKLSNDSVALAATKTGITEIPNGSAIYYTRLTAPLVVGPYAVVWRIGTETASDVLEVYSTEIPGSKSEDPTGTNLISLAQLKIAMGITAAEVDLVRDEKLELSIADASAAIRSYADRSFGLPAVKGNRIYEYDASGYLDIDDAVSVESLVFIFGSLETPIEPFYWRAEPQEGPPYTYLTVPQWSGSISPEMGFTYNLDVISKDRGWPGLIPTIKVTGEFGWPEVPADVQRAAIWTAAAMAEKPDEMVSESIAGYSYTSANRTSSAVTAIPSRAKDLLAAYERFQV
jgi:hypothetical protein